MQCTIWMTNLPLVVFTVYCVCVCVRACVCAIDSTVIVLL